MNIDLDEAAALLARTPATLRALLADLPGAWTEANEGEGTFSPRDVLGHLIDGEELDWIPRARIVMEHGPERAFEPFDRTAFRERYGSLSVGELLERFASLRARNLEELARMRLAPSDLDRQGSHPALGRVTLGNLIATWVVHDLSHLSQIARVASKRYSKAVGPWKAYLPILTR